MAPRGQTLPQATTESAREARKSFFCELCQKGYARMNDYEAHLGSYDHSHRQRLKDVRQLTKDPNAAAKAREAERRANEEAGMKSLDISSLGSGGATTAKKKKTPVFKSTLQPHNAAVLGLPSSAPPVGGAAEGDGNGDDLDDPDGAKANDWEDDRFDPFAPLCEECGDGVCEKMPSDSDIEEMIDEAKEDLKAAKEQVEREGLMRQKATGKWWLKPVPI